MHQHSDMTIENRELDPGTPQNKGILQEGFLEIVLQHYRAVLLTAILFLTAGFFYILVATPIYTSASRLYVEQNGPKIISDYEGLMTQSKNYLYTQSELLKSTPIVAKVANNAQIKKLKTFAHVDNLVAYLKKNLNVKVGKKDDIVTVSFDSPYPIEAAQIVNATVDSYIRYHSTRKRSTVSEVLKILQKEKAKRDKEISEKFEHLLSFTRANGIVSFDNNGGNIVFQRLAKLSEALTEAQLTTINAKADYEAVKNIADDPAKIKQFAMAQPSSGVHIFVNDEETQLRFELQNMEAKLKNARRHCTKEHPLILSIQSKIDYIEEELQNRAKGFAEAYIEVMRQRWIMAKQREDELLASFDSQHLEARSLGVKATEYSVLQSELKRTERLCEILDERIKELNVTEDTGALNISILEVARVEDKPSKPQKAQVLAIALAFGLMFGCGFAHLCDWLDYRLRSIEEVSAVLGIPVLGVVPSMSEGRTIAAHSQKVLHNFKDILANAYQRIHSAVLSRILQIKRGAVVAATSTSSDMKSTSKKQNLSECGQEVHLKPRSIVAEAYRTIRTSVFFGVPKDEAKTILITSPAPGDGKTTCASNLAIAMAKAGQKTLVFDCDLRKPMQHNIFEIDNKKGISSVFAGNITLDEAIRHNSIEGLDILTCGPEVPNPSEILNSRVFVETLRELSQRYDRIIIDSPPATPVTDSQILGAICDITLLVIRAEKSTRKVSRQAFDSLLNIGAHVLGVIVNDVPRSGGRYGYTSSAYYNYGYCDHRGGEKKKEYPQSSKPTIKSVPIDTIYSK